MTLRERLPALRHPAYRTYLVGAFVSNIGNHIQGTAIAWHIYALTNDSLMVGLLGLVRVVPLIVFSLIGGVVADQVDRRRVMFFTQSSLAMIALVLGILTWHGAERVVHLYILVGMAAVARAFDGPSRQAMVVSLVPAQDFPNAASLNGTAFRLTDVLGPVAAGLMIAWPGALGVSGLAWCYLTNSASFIALLYAVYLLPSRSPLQEGDARVRTIKQVFGSIGDGISFVRRTAAVRQALLIDFWATFFASADVLLPAFASAKILDLGPKGYGVLSGASGFGALVAAASLAIFPTVRNQGRWVVGMVALYGFFTIGFGLSPNLTLACIFLAGAGAADMVSTVLRQTIRQLSTPDGMRGRMTSVSMLFHTTGPQLGNFESGLVARLTGERISVVVGGAASLIVAGIWVRARELMGYRHEPAPPTPDVAEVNGNGLTS